MARASYAGFKKTVLSLPWAWHSSLPFCGSSNTSGLSLSIKVMFTFLNVLRYISRYADTLSILYCKLYCLEDVRLYILEFCQTPPTDEFKQAREAVERKWQFRLLSNYPSGMNRDDALPTG